MTTPTPTPPQSTAIAAFLRGVERRAWLLARAQSGQPVAAQRALAVTQQVFVSDAEQWPIAQWPLQYWRLLLAAPSMRKPPVAGPAARLPGIARLPVEARAAVLLHLVAALDDADAAGALGIGTAAYQARIRDALPLDALDQPDVDVWRAWRAAAERELAQATEPEAPTAVPARPAPQVRAHSPLVDVDTRHRHRLRWLWVGVALCVVAMVATFFLHPRGREVLDQWRAEIKREPLDAAATPKARFDAADLALHPDRDLLSMPGELAFAHQLPLLAWLVDAGADPRAADAVRLPVIVQAANAGIATIASDDVALRRRVQRWNALPPKARAARRGAWQAWRALPAVERMRLRDTAARWRLLASEEQAALRARFDALPADARHGWWLGPELGRDWPRVAPLFAFAAESQRDPLLALLRAADAEDIDVLERLAQITPPEERDALRLDLLRVPAAERRAWMLAKVQG